MTPQERDLITQLFNRLRQSAKEPKDREAETLIGQGLQQSPDAPYLLVQTVLIQDMALAEAQHRIADLERQAAAATEPQPQPTSFLAGARGSVPNAGPWSRPAAMPSPVQQAAPQPSPVAPLAAPQASSGFLRHAAATAASVAGGALLFQAISSLFGPHYGYGGLFSGIGAQPGLGETVINNYYDQPTTDPGDAGGNDPGFAQADDNAAVDDPGFGGDDQGGSDGGDFGGDGGSIDV